MDLFDWLIHYHKTKMIILDVEDFVVVQEVS